MRQQGNTPLKIGIFIREFHTLRNYELQIVERIIDDPNLELILLVKDGRKDINNIKSRFFKNVFSKKVFGNILFKIQCTIEEKIFPISAAGDKTKVIDELKKIECIEVSPNRKGFLDVFSDDDSEKVKGYNLDVILRHEFSIIRGKILESSKYGIWSFHHGDNAVNRGGPAGFWEILFNEPYVGVTLQQLTSTLDGGNVIDKANFSWNYSYIVTNNDILESSVSLLMKNLNKLIKGEFVCKKSLIYFNPLYKKPDLKNVLIYMFKFYSSLFEKVFYKVLTSVSSKRKYCWYLYASKGVFMESQLFTKKEIPLPKNEFWADPFLINYNNEMYAFFENYEYDKAKGKISCAKIIDNTFVNIQDVLNLPYHLSYPFIVNIGSDVFMIPETQANKRMEVYKCTQFPDKWELFSTAFENEEIVDTTYYKDEDGENWLFLNKGYRNKPELYIYKIDSLELKSIESHTSNPVKIDSLTARNAGAIFIYENQYYRPSQVNSHGKYGNGLNINRIIKLNIDEYEEETIITVLPNFKRGLVGLHHLHQIDNYYIFDVCQKLK